MDDGTDNYALRHMKPRELALHLRHASEKLSTRAVFTELLQAVELEVLPPTVFNTFMTSVRSPWPLKEALLQRHSKHVRITAIRRFGKYLKGVNWEDAWQEVGGTQGLLDLFSQLSVLEVKELCKVIGCSPGRSAVKNCTERQSRVTELVQSLMSPLYPSSPYQSKDQRPLHHHYAKLVPACTSEFVERLLLHQQSHPLLKSLPKKMLVQHHFELLRRLVLSAISHDDSMQGTTAYRFQDFIPLLLQYAPPGPFTEPRFSTSMSLAVTILEKTTVGREDHFPESMFIPVLMLPLTRRLQAHRVDPNRVQQIIQLAAKYLRKREQARAQLSLEKEHLICYIARAWSHAPSLFQECLTEFISLLCNGAQRHLSCYKDLICQVIKHRRYDLLRMICLYSTGIQTNIESDDGLKSMPIKRWPIFIFQVLQQDHSLSLLQNLVRLKSDADFLELASDYSILSQGRSPDSYFGDPHLLLAILQPEKEGAEHEAQKNILETLKSKASKSREQTDRGFFAKSAAFYAIATGSLELYDEVVHWTRRFLRDPMTVKTVYSSSATLTVEGVTLLGGVPEDLDPWNTAQICERVTKANSIMLYFLDTAVTSLSEPSFYSPDWYGPLSLFFKVVVIRMSNAGRLKCHFHLSEDEIYDLLWSQTIEMLLRAEEIGLQYEPLKFHSAEGPLSFTRVNSHGSKAALPSFYRFLDNLARSRDALWKKYRPTMNPEVAALEPPWPRGLPIQYLMGPFNVAVDRAYAQTPFIADRAVEVIMTDPALACVEATNHERVKRVVGGFIDKFDIALAIYVKQCPPGHEQDNRVHAAWCHAINALSHGPIATSSHATGSTFGARLSETEADSFWRDIFERALPGVKLPASEIKVNVEYPAIPTEIDDPRETYEWNPAAMVPPELKSRKLAVTILDYMLLTSIGEPYPHTQAIVSPPIWSPERLKHLRKISKPVQEGMIATALLIESSKIERSNILALPFPSESNVRYPSLFLDHDFLLSIESLYPLAASVLSHFIKSVPSSLLFDLTSSALEALSRTPSESTKFASTQRAAYWILILLSKSDRPHLASELIVRTVLDCPDASSWHRRLLSRKFLRNLSASQAQDVISLFASSIHEVLEGQVTRSSSQQKAECLKLSSDRYVKVTTVKYLAQLLDDADFVPPRYCIDVLINLLQNATNMDIRVAVLDSILSRLGRCVDVSSDALAERLMSALEFAIPIIGSLNERQQTREVDWTEAEKTGRLPEVYEDGGMHSFPPMLNAILRAMTSYGISSDKLRTDFIRRIVLPVIEKSMEESARWVKLFTLKHSPADQSIHIPSFPVRPRVLVYVIEECFMNVPQYLLDLYQQFFLTNVSPSAELVMLNNKVNSDYELRSSNEGQYWLSLYGQGVKVSTSVIVSLLTKPKHWLAALDKVRISHVQDMVFEQADAMLQVVDESFGRWDGFKALLEPPLAQYQSNLDRKAWSANGKPVILRIIKRIDALRTSAWQRDRNRRPAILPDTFRLRLWLLDYPQVSRSSDACTTFAQQVISILQEIINLGLSQYFRLDQIKFALSECLPEDARRVAWCLGSIDLEDSTKLQENILRAELVDGMLRKFQLPQNRDNEIIQPIKAMLDAWRDCEVEDIRLRGIRLGKHLKM